MCRMYKGLPLFSEKSEKISPNSEFRPLFISAVNVTLWTIPRESNRERPSLIRRMFYERLSFQCD